MEEQRTYYDFESICDHASDEAFEVLGVDITDMCEDMVWDTAPVGDDLAIYKDGDGALVACADGFAIYGKGFKVSGKLPSVYIASAEYNTVDGRVRGTTTYNMTKLAAAINARLGCQAITPAAGGVFTNRLKGL